MAGWQGIKREKETKTTILEFLKDKDEAGFSKIADYCCRKGISRMTVKKYLDEMKKEGLIKQSIEGRHPYSITDKGKEYYRREGLKENLVRKVDSADPAALEFLERKLATLEKELEHYKNLQRIHGLEECPLPLTAVIKKLLTLGFKIEDFYDIKSLDPRDKQLFQEIPNRVRISTNKLDKYFMGGGGPDFRHDYEFSPDEIEIKLIPESEVEGVTFINGESERKQHMLMSDEVERKYGLGWIILTPEPIKGYYIIGAYKELLQLYTERFEYEWLSYKEKYNLMDEDWKIVGPWVAWTMLFEAGRVDLPIEIEDYIRVYLQTKSPNGFEELKRTYMRFNDLTEKQAEESAKRTIEDFRELAKKPVEEIWLEYEDEIKYMNEGTQRIFQYLKNKYAK
jgi:predicted transcriptional regulator